MVVDINELEEETAATTAWLEVAVMAVTLPGEKEFTPEEVVATVADMLESYCCLDM